MHNRFFHGFAVTALAGSLAVALAIASPVLARGGGGGGGGHGGGMGGGGHGGGWGGGMHAMGGGGWGGGMHAMGGGGWHGSAMGSHFAMAPASRATFSPSFSHGTFSPQFSHGTFSPRFSHFAFRDRDDFRRGFFRDRDDFRFHHRFRRFAFFGAPFYYDDYAYSGCLRRVWTRFGLRWVNVCGYGDVY